MNCPYLMQDGRQFTDYKSSNYSYEVLRKRYNVPENEMRNFLINNGDKISDSMQTEAIMSMACPEPQGVVPNYFSVGF